MAIPEWAGDHGSSRGDWVWTTKQRLSMLKAPTGITECAQRKNLRRKIEVPPKTRNRREHGLRQSGGKAESTLRGGRNRCQSRTTPAPMSEDQNRKGAPLMDTGTMNGASVSSFVHRKRRRGKPTGSIPGDSNVISIWSPPSLSQFRGQC